MNAVGTPLQVKLELPLAALILGFTAVPIAFAPVDWAALEGLWGSWPDFIDIAANVLLYLPLGLALAWRGWRLALVIAAAVSVSAEAVQFLSALRAPSLIDILANIAGAGAGVLIGVRWLKRPLVLTITRPRALIAALCAALLAWATPYISPRAIERAVNLFAAAPAATSGVRPTNPRGVTEVGRLEAHWTFDADGGATIEDASEAGLSGTPVRDPPHIPGAVGAALQLNGENQYVEIGNAEQLKLSGSMTISAWINSSAFSDDDAAIVSSLDRVGLGYQLDTTIDEGPRTIALKLASADGSLAARYGQTPLSPRRWYHVAGVYDAQARTLDVYLNGRSDNGCLLGPVTNRQLASDVDTYLGRRAEFAGGYFAGAIDDVRIYSRALSAAEIATQFEETRTARANAETELRGPTQPEMCGREARADPTVAGLLVLLGQLVAFALLGLWAGAGRLSVMAAALAAGGGVALVMATAQPLVPVVLPPLLALAGVASILFAPRVPTTRQPNS